MTPAIKIPIIRITIESSINEKARFLFFILTDFLLKKVTSFPEMKRVGDELEFNFIHRQALSLAISHLNKSLLHNESLMLYFKLLKRNYSD